MEYLLTERDKAIHRLESERSQYQKQLKIFSKYIEELENELSDCSLTEKRTTYKRFSSISDSVNNENASGKTI